MKQTQILHHFSVVEHCLGTGKVYEVQMLADKNATLSW